MEQYKVPTVYDVYPNAHAAARSRFGGLCETFAATWGAQDALRCFSAPGRAEIGGNHTDHQHGRILAAAVGLDMMAAVSPRSDKTVRILSEGFLPFEISLEQLSPCEAEQSSPAAMVRGVCEYYVKNGYTVGGFDACINSEIPAGASLSSSACFAVLIAAIQSGLYNGGAVPFEQMAIAAKWAENHHFGKPCGLMDQLACASGGFISVDFLDESAPAVRRLQFDPQRHGYVLCILNAGGSHANLTDQYAAIPEEMGAVAKAFGQPYLRLVEPETFYENIGALRKSLPDRALMRAMHFFDEDRRAFEEAQALIEDDFAAFLKLVDASGRSSEQLLENVSPRDAQERSLALAIGYAKRILGENGVVRVQGGGFAGTAEAFVRSEALPHFTEEFEKLFGEGSVLVLPVRQYGGTEVCLAEKE